MLDIRSDDFSVLPVIDENRPQSSVMGESQGRIALDMSTTESRAIFSRQLGSNDMSKSR